MNCFENSFCSYTFDRLNKRYTRNRWSLGEQILQGKLRFHMISCLAGGYSRCTNHTYQSKCTAHLNQKSIKIKLSILQEPMD